MQSFAETRMYGRPCWMCVRSCIFKYVGSSVSAGGSLKITSPYEVVGDSVMLLSNFQLLKRGSSLFGLLSVGRQCVTNPISRPQTQTFGLRGDGTGIAQLACMLKWVSTQFLYARPSSLGSSVASVALFRWVDVIPFRRRFGVPSSLSDGVGVLDRFASDK